MKTSTHTARPLPRPTCSACRFWGPEFYIEDKIKTGCCTHLMVIQPTYGMNDNRKMRPDGVMTCDEGGGTGELMTGPDFGCIHFEQNLLLSSTSADLPAD